MTLGELQRAIERLRGDGVDHNEEVCIEYYGSCLSIQSMAVVVQSDLWVPETVVITADLMVDGEADDG